MTTQLAKVDKYPISQSFLLGQIVKCLKKTQKIDYL